MRDTRLPAGRTVTQSEEGQRKSERELSTPERLPEKKKSLWYHHIETESLRILVTELSEILRNRERAGSRY